ncbi:MAG: SAM-dependent methyltransferase [Acidiphilium sp. 37-64-53]|uniref:class I SAM-dependent methyltransferase n=2 Tax=Acidocellaceae TaxID=3385905 RepID=UPI000BC704CA|nr:MULTISPECIES: SAM-dependent methyltransferase [Acidiphilium]OYW04033.1 MAG: SAM-dependent methyltransferase [Acidiphilium sp. 37-64-53]OZB29042.1 MAG: SAM-dependent methyltransferase [Acidiphilium sp. 34-64-41]
MTERLDHFMARANAAYYATHDPFLDFTTSPEISQVFGELIGLWAALAWQTMGAPRNILLVEAGPGNGTLMNDALRAIGRSVPAFASALSLHFIETSPRLMSSLEQKQPNATFHADLTTLPQGPMIFLANEFLDALPIRQFIRRPDGWMERHVRDNGFIELPTDFIMQDETCGAIYERNPIAEALVATLAYRLVETTGVALMIDYGPMRSGPGETLQAISNRQPVSPTSNPGSADLTAHVDFERLTSAIRRAGAKAWGPITQGHFLTALGIHERTNQLGKRASPEQAFKLIAASRRLTAPEAMGNLFKAIAISHPSIQELAGFSS